MHVLRTNTDRERVSLRAITLGAVACLAAFTRADTYLFEQRSEPEGLFTATSVYVLDNTTTQTLNAAEVASGYSFAYWTVNGERATNVLGQSITQAPCLIIGTNVMAIAWYMSPLTDTDGDGNADFLEFRIYGTLDHIGSDDTEGDGFTYAEELTRGYSPIVPDEPSDGGVMMRLSSSAVTLRDESVKKRYEIRSDPQGIVTLQTGYVTTGTVVTTPSIPYGASSGYYFGYWEVNGVRQASGSGLALSSVAMTLTNDMIAIARFFSAGDSDADGLADWREWYWFGALSLTPDDDPDADGFTIADELMHGYAVQVSDEPSDGGVMMRLSSAAIFSLAGVPLAHAGSNRLCQVGDTVNLDGQSSLNASNCLWRLLSTPTFSEASISNETSLTASFMPEVAGVYMIELVVGNGLAQSLPDTLTLTASPWPVVNLTVTSDFGSPWPSLGMHTYVGGTIITAAVQQVVNFGQTRYVCLGWTGTFSVPVFGTNAITRPFSLDRDSRLDWKWRTEYWLEGTVVGQGTIEGANRWVAAGTHANLSVTPSEGWFFIGWSDGLSGRRDLTSLDVAMDRPQRFVAHFSDDVDNDGLSNAQEISLGTDPWSTDSDNDGFGDAWEVGNNWNPTHPDNAVLAYIQGNASNFGLISSNQVGNLDSGSLAITVSNNMVYLSLQIQASQNLLDWTNAGAPVIWSYPVQTNSSFFYRVQSRGL